MSKPVITTLVLLAVLISAVNCGTPAAPSTICNMKVSDLLTCLPAITGKSPPWPTQGCCSVIRRANLKCFCSYKSQLAKFGVDPAKAMALPKKCGAMVPKACIK